MNDIKVTERFVSAPAPEGSPCGLFLDYSLSDGGSIQVTLSDGRTAMQLAITVAEAMATVETLKAMVAKLGVPSSAVKN